MPTTPFRRILSRIAPLVSALPKVWGKAVGDAPVGRAALALTALALVAGCATAPPSGTATAPPADGAPVTSATATAGDGAPAATPPDAPSVSRDGEPIATELALATFDSAWSRISVSYYDPDFRGLDWAGVRDELRPSVAEVETRGELRAILRDMLSRLGESHFAIFPQESVDAISVDGDDGRDGGDEGDGADGARDGAGDPRRDGDEDASDASEGDVGLEFRWIDGDLTVFRAHDGAARDAGVRPGWVLEALGERDLDRWRQVLAEAESESARTGLETETVSAAHSYLRGSVGSEVELRFRDGEGAVRTLTLDRRPLRGEMVKFGALPAMEAYLDHRRVPRGDGCVGVIEFNVWMAPLVAEFNGAVDDLGDCAGMVIDLRGNPGGLGGMVMSTAGSFFAERADLGVMKSRTGEIRFVAMPRGVDTRGALRDPFAGRLAILIDEMSMSTSEIFAAGLKSTGRARLFGTTTPGYALPAMTMPLPNDDVLYHVISNLTDPEGQRIEGQGVAPDEAVPLRRADLLAGRDAALEAALAWAAGGA